MALNLFGVDADAVRRHHFPMQDTFDTTTTPSAATVAEIITAQAAILEGKLQAELIEPDSITDASTSAYLWCANTLRLMAAPMVVRAGLEVEEGLVTDLETERDARLTDLSDSGYLALGDGVATPAVAANGPTTFIDVFGIKTQRTSDMSSLAHNLLRRDDEL